MFTSGWLAAGAAIGACAGCGGVSERRSGEGSEPPASCGLRSQFADDEACLPPMDPASGFSLHFGPDDHDDPGEFLLPPGEETTECKIVGALPRDVYVERWVASSRSNVFDFELLAAPAGIDPCTSHRARLLAMSDGGRLDIRIGAAPEYARAAMRIGADEQIAIQVHAINPTLEQVLREVWLNAHTAPRSAISEVADTLALIATQQGAERSVFGGSVTIPSDRPLLGLSGHAHFVETLDVIHVRGDQRTLLYRHQSEYLTEPHGFLRYDSVSLNPAEGEHSNTVGSSGPVLLAAGDRLEWSCLPTEAEPPQPTLVETRYPRTPLFLARLVPAERWALVERALT